MSNILIVDDEAFIPPLLGDYLSRLGHSVMEARSARGASLHTVIVPGQQRLLLCA